ncbi:hypothetical protein GCM10022403_020630 [Streptomyces coacervatus]|uniref:Uncharacterized protein n=1 Tax=Streptomyces coacervatus TaxID=647381 RepID=A0ABP7H8W6_9ACTN
MPGGAPGVGDVDQGLLVDVRVRDRLGNQQASWGEELGDPVEQGLRVAADADVAVDEEDGAPVALGGEWFEDGAVQGGAAAGDRAGDGSFADVDAQCYRMPSVVCGAVVAGRAVPRAP